jgi:hypothetical protein
VRRISPNDGPAKPRREAGILQYGTPDPDAPTIDFNDPAQNGGDTHWLAQPRRRAPLRVEPRRRHQGK